MATRDYVEFGVNSKGEFGLETATLFWFRHGIFNRTREATFFGGTGKTKLAG
jgi:hypothetical protein